VADIIGPLFVIVLVFVVYHFAGKMDTAADVKRSQLEVSRIEAEARRTEIEIESKRLDVEMGKLAIEAKKLGFDTSTIPAAKGAEYKILEEKKKE